MSPRGGESVTAYMPDVLVNINDVPRLGLLGVVPIYKTKGAAKHACPTAVLIDPVEIDDEEGPELDP